MRIILPVVLIVDHCEQAEQVVIGLIAPPLGPGLFQWALAGTLRLRAYTRSWGLSKLLEPATGPRGLGRIAGPDPGVELSRRGIVGSGWLHISRPASRLRLVFEPSQAPI